MKAQGRNCAAIVHHYDASKEEWIADEICLVSIRQDSAMNSYQMVGKQETINRTVSAVPITEALNYQKVNDTFHQWLLSDGIGVRKGYHIP